MMIEIDDDFLDTIIQGALVKDYIHLTNDLKLHSKNNDYLHEDDARAYEETAGAILTLSKWYFVKGEFDKQVKQARKKK
jgi:hypothetical protein